MSKAPAILLLSLALTGCAAVPQARLAPDSFEPALYAWDGAGEDPDQPRLAAAPSRSVPVAARADQPQDVVDAEQDARLNRSLVICKGCLPPQPTEGGRLAKASD